MGWEPAVRAGYRAYGGWLSAEPPAELPCVRLACWEVGHHSHLTRWRHNAMPVAGDGLSGEPWRVEGEEVRLVAELG